MGVLEQMSVGTAMRAYSVDLRERTGGLAPRPRPGGQAEIGPAQYPVLRV